MCCFIVYFINLFYELIFSWIFLNVDLRASPLDAGLCLFYLPHVLELYLMSQTFHSWNRVWRRSLGYRFSGWQQSRPTSRTPNIFPFHSSLDSLVSVLCYCFSYLFHWDCHCVRSLRAFIENLNSKTAPCRDSRSPICHRLLKCKLLGSRDCHSVPHPQSCM